MSIRRAMAQTLVSRQAHLALQFLRLVVLARLLQPEDFGWFAVAIAVHGVAATIVGMGLRPFLIRRETLDRDTLGAAIGLSLTLALVLIAACAGAVVLFSDPGWPAGATWLAAALALELLTRPFILPIEAALQRSLRFGLLSLVAVLRGVVQTAVAIALAFGGAGAVALAGGVLAEGLAAAAILAGVAGQGRLVRPRFRGWGQFWRFGAQYTTIDLLGGLGDLLVATSVSRFLGVGVLGQLNRARTVVHLFDRSFLDGVAPVVLPALTTSLRNGRAPLDLYLLKVDYLTALCWPAFALVALLAEPLVDVLLGSQWHDTARAIQLLALLGLSLPFTKMSNPYFVALGMTDTFLRIQFVVLVARAGFAAGGALISLDAVCIGVALAGGVKAALLAAPLKRATGYRFRDVLEPCARSALITLATVIGPAMVLLWLPTVPAPLTLAVAGAVAGVGWLVSLLLTRHPLVGHLTVIARQAYRRSL